jgi:hypothetical protein
MDKQLYQSLTVQGAVVMLLGYWAKSSGVEIGSEELTNVLTALIVVVGFVANVIGRIRAAKNLKFGSKKL